jgi:hypothetical protein
LLTVGKIAEFSVVSSALPADHHPAGVAGGISAPLLS